MLFVHPIDVVRTIETSVQTELDLSITENIEILDELTHCFHIRDVAGEFTIVKRQAGFLAKQKGKIDLWKAIIIFVLAILYLL